MQNIEIDYRANLTNSAFAMGQAVGGIKPLKNLAKRDFADARVNGGITDEEAAELFRKGVKAGVKAAKGGVWDSSDDELLKVELYQARQFVAHIAFVPKSQLSTVMNPNWNGMKPAISTLASKAKLASIAAKDAKALDDKRAAEMDAATDAATVELPAEHSVSADAPVDSGKPKGADGQPRKERAPAGDAIAAAMIQLATILDNGIELSDEQASAYATLSEAMARFEAARVPVAEAA